MEAGLEGCRAKLGAVGVALWPELPARAGEWPRGRWLPSTAMLASIKPMALLRPWLSLASKGVGPRPALAVVPPGSEQPRRPS